MAFKMKGSPMERNFGVSPVKQKDPFEKLYKKVNPKDPKAIKGKHYPSKETVKKLQKGPYAKGGQNANVAESKKPKYPKNFNSTGSSKAGKLAKVAKKAIGKIARFAGGKALGVAGMLMATSSKADQPKKGKGKIEYPGGKIDFTKQK